MFCPSCKDEFRPGFTRCATCNVDLVDSLSDVATAPVKEKTSGILEIQRIIAPHGERGRNPATTEVELVPSTFLVDVVTGDTWILRRRASTNASWDKVELFTHSNWGSN